VSQSRAFDHACETLERKTKLSRLEARGTVRLALKAAGLDAGRVTARQMGVVFERIMPGELGRAASARRTRSAAISSALLQRCRATGRARRRRACSGASAAT